MVMLAAAVSPRLRSLRCCRRLRAQGGAFRVGTSAGSVLARAGGCPVKVLLEKLGEGVNVDGV